MSSQKGEDATGPSADWRLPPGVDRALWDYLHSPAIARDYDALLAESSLFRVDLSFVDRYFPSPGWLIDLGCGTGRLLIAQARRGNRVLGVDLSAEMLAVAHDRAREAGVRVELLKANLTRLDVLAGNSFDCAACLFSTLGMVRGNGERARVIEQAYRLLRPGGRFVLHVHNRWFNLWDREGRHWLLRSLCHGRQAGDRTMPTHQGIANLTLHLFTRREACRLLQRAGFQIVEIKPISLRTDGELKAAWWFGWLRAYGYLIAAEK